MNTISIQPIQPFDTENVDLRAAWTPDGRWLAYSDLNGLWIWDALTPSQQPRLLLPTVDNQIPFARLFSGGGRYLSVQQGNERFILDIDTDIRLPDGLVAANDRSMLVFDTFQNRWKPDEIYRMWLPSQQREDVLNFVYTDWIYQIEALQEDFALSGCGTTYADDASGVIHSQFSCGIGRFDPSSFSPYRGTQGYSFDYHPETGQLAAIRDEFQVWIDGRIIDFSDDISSPIMQIEWLPSLFYYGN